jgi:uncharacterized damage-inducible protein DinB
MTIKRTAKMRFVGVLGILLICLSVGALAESSDEAFEQSLVGSLDIAGRKMIALAEATPAEQFSWRPVEGVRSISQVYMHVVGNNFQIPAILGADPPDGMDIPERPYDRRMQKKGWEEEIRDKPAVIDQLKKSFDYAASAIPEISDLDEIVAPLGFRDSKRNYLLLLVAHAHEHLGQSIAYARGAGVVPPWSQAPERARADSVAVLDGDSARGAIVSIDRFGNLVTNLVEADLEELGLAVGDTLSVQVGEASAEAFVGDFMSDVSHGEWFAVVNATGTLTIGRSYDSAEATMSCGAGEPIVIRAAVPGGHVLNSQN